MWPKRLWIEEGEGEEGGRGTESWEWGGAVVAVVVVESVASLRAW